MTMDAHEDRSLEDANDSLFRGPNSTHVKLISKDQQTFVIRRKYAVISGYIRKLLNNRIRENQLNEIVLSEIHSRVLIKICKYLVLVCAQMTNPSEKITMDMDSELAFDVLMAGTILDY